VKLLAIDTSSVACSVAVQAGETVVERHEEKAREHTRILLPMINEALAECGLALADLDAIVLGNGPGSFIGMRIAASVAQGLAFGAGLDIVPVSSMAAVAAEVLADDDAEEVVVTQDAHMNEVYLGHYRRDSAGLPEEVTAERLQSISPIEGFGECGRRVAAGFGWERYPALLDMNAGRIGSVSETRFPRASYLLPLGGRSLAAGGAIRPQDIVPAYLRQKVAEKPATAP